MHEGMKSVIYLNLQSEEALSDDLLVRWEWGEWKIVVRKRVT
jgi:hypothetical protein